MYREKGYIVCHTTYDQDSPLLYDMVGNISQLDDFVKCAELIKKERHAKTISFPLVLRYLKMNPDFKYKAIRVWPYPKHVNNSAVIFPDNSIVLGKIDKIQICFFDRTLLTEPFRIVYKETSVENQTI